MIDNAIKNSPKETLKVKITSEIIQNKVVISVKDTEVGINEENLEKIFEKFVLILTKYSVKRTRIFLFISRMIAEAHGSKLYAKSEGLGKGSCFILELPYEEEYFDN